MVVIRAKLAHLRPGGRLYIYIILPNHTEQLLAFSIFTSRV